MKPVWLDRRPLIGQAAEGVVADQADDMFQSGMVLGTVADSMVDMTPSSFVYSLFLNGEFNSKIKRITCVCVHVCM